MSLIYNEEMELLRECRLCPHECKVNRLEGKKGRCKSDYNVKISLADLHFFEEPCISGKNGSGTVFFTGCNMNCVFCQNYEISQLFNGKIISINELSEVFLMLQNKGAHNINLVTGAIYVPQIIQAIKLARQLGLTIPIVYNSSGYEKKETIKLLDGYIDVYLPDLKYYYNELAKDLSGIDNYFEIANECIKEMYKQVGNVVLDKNGIIKKGLIIRHLVLPNHILNTKKVLEWISNNIPKNIYISVMFQYFPEYKACNRHDINRGINLEEFNRVKKYIEKYDLTNGYIQELEKDNEKKYVPKWNIK